MLGNKQLAFGIGTNQEINNIFVDAKYTKDILDLIEHPSLLNEVIFTLFDSINSSDVKNEDEIFKHPKIKDKIQYNSIKTARFKIEELYSENAYYINSAYENLDMHSPGNKALLLDYLHTLYLEIVGSLSCDYSKSKLDIVLENNNADLILEQIITKLLLSIVASRSRRESISQEQLKLSLSIIVYHAFVECKILENPNK